MQVSYSPTERQAAAHSCPADILCYGGAAGGGKSIYLLMEALVSCLEMPGFVCMLMRRTFPELEGSLIMESRKLFPPEICKYNEAKHVWTIRAGGTYSYIFFGYCEKETDVFKYQSAQWQMLGLDESTHFTQWQFEMLYSRVRSAIPGANPRARLCTNPGNIGHGWHKKYFKIPCKDSKDTLLPGTIWRPPLTMGQTVQPPTRCFIPSRVYDNPYLMKADPAYLGRLEALPPVQRAMLLYGEWDSFAGQFFPEFDKGKHVVPRFEIPRHWKVWRALDFGFNDPFVCLWIAGSPDGHYYAFRELYMRELRDKQQVAQVKLGSNWRHLEPMEIEYTVGDPSMRAKSKDTGISTQQIFLDAGVAVIPASNARVPGWMALRNLLSLDPKTGTPWLQMTDDCQNLIREFEEAISDQTNPEDVNTDGSDHAIDSARYFGMSRPNAMILNAQPEEINARLDEAGRREWRAHSQRSRDINSGRNQATLHNLNREGDDEWPT